MFGWNEAAWFSFFLGAALKSTAVLSAAWIAAFLLRRRSAAARHLVWTGAAAAVVALPLLSISLPALRTPTVAGLRLAVPPTFRTTAVAGHGTGASQAAEHENPGAPGQPAAWRTDWKITVMLLWAIGAAAALGQLLAAAAAIARVRRSAKPFADRDLCGALSQALGIRHSVDVLETKAGTMPMTCGILRSAVFMPSDACEWTEERRRVVLLHELAHVRRGDVVTHVLARAALTMYWWNPLAWTAWREFLKERERATDDLVLNAGTRASDYAAHLLEVARAMRCSPALGWAAVAMARRSQLEGRLLAILDSGVNRKSTGRAGALAAAIVALGIVAPLAAVQAQDTREQSVPADVDAAIRSAMAQKNHEILESAAKAAEQLRNFDTAQKLLTSAVAIRASVSGAQSVEYGIGLLKLGELESRRHNTASAEDFYSKAAQVLGDRPEASRALLYLGTSALANKNLAQAMDYFQHAQRIDPQHAGTAMMWMAVVRERSADVYEAEALFKNAVALDDPQSAIILKVYAQFLRRQGRGDEAAGLEARASALQKANTAQVTSATAPATGVYRIGNGVAPPRVLAKVEPEYSEEARAAGFAGTVTVSVEIGTDGLAHNPLVTRGLGLGLDERAIDAISQWRFQPGMKDGQPVAVYATIEVNFKLL